VHVTTVGFGAQAAVRSELGSRFSRHGSAQNLTQVVWERHVEVFICKCGILKHGVAKNRCSLVGEVQDVMHSDLGACAVAWKTISLSI
jgi:hypothetical protein